MKNLLIDMTRYRECGSGSCDQPVPEGLVKGSPEKSGLKSLRELASFVYTCRRCEDAPCVSVCPEEALKKNEEGMILRSSNLCVACKSCVIACPFGTMPSDFYQYKRDETLYYDLMQEEERERFVKESPEGSVRFTEESADEDTNIYELLPGILIKDYSWEKLKNLE
jgi:formate dehydrogenase iron-sulfur subunit